MKADIAEGPCHEFYKNGQLMASYFVKDGLKEGEYKTWYEDGQLKYCAEMKGGYRRGRVYRMV